MKKKRSNASAEINAINDHYDGIIRIDGTPDVVQAVSDALTGDTPTGNGDWMVIGCLPLGGAATIKGVEGQPLFRLSLEAAKDAKGNPIPVHDDPKANFTLLVERNAAGGVKKLTIDFSRTMDYSLIDENQSKAATVALIDKFGLGNLGKHKS